jgi:hypothetical protein
VRVVPVWPALCPAAAKPASIEWAATLTSTACAVLGAPAAIVCA